MSEKALVIHEDRQTDLSVQLSETAVSSFFQQRVQLAEFIKGSLKEGVDFGIIPGCEKPSLYKPGAEKIANIFQLGSRILNVDKTISFEHPQFGMFTYTIEIYHLPSGKSISQCQGSCNSEEKKYKKVGIGDLLNTMQKMAQKRAYVGAVIMATGASDFFTQDTEDLPKEMLGDTTDTGELTDSYIVKYGRDKGKPLSACVKASLKGYVEWAKDKTAPKLKEDAEIVNSYLNNPELFQKVVG